MHIESLGRYSGSLAMFMQILLGIRAYLSGYVNVGIVGRALSNQVLKCHWEPAGPVSQFSQVMTKGGGV